MTVFESQLPLIYLKPSEIYIAGEPALVETVLGSCVSITMHNRRSGVGIMCHCLLPRCKNERPCDGACSGEFKYVDCSIRRMTEKFDSYDIKRSDIEVKVFGGADMFTGGKSISVGRQNIETALKIIKNEGLNLSASDVGGTQGRKIFFYTHTGEVLLKRLKGSIHGLKVMNHGRDNISKE
jgi:chemotaxis protein CheD